MEALTWSAQFETGLGAVDEQHRRLVALSNEFGELASRQASVPRARLEAVITELARYAQIHFAEEEQLMQSSGVDARFVTAHVAQHNRFLREVTEMRASNFLDAPDTVRVVFQFLLQWLATHILGSDMQLARQVERLRKGERAEEAFRAETHGADRSASLLLGALDDLMRVVAQRNVALAESRATLEARVAARTKDLNATVEALRATHERLVETGKLVAAAPVASGLAQALGPPLSSVQSKVGALGDHARALLEVVDIAEGLTPTLPPPATAALAEARRRADVAFVREDLDLLLAETQEELKKVQGLVTDLRAYTSPEADAVVDLDLASCVQTLLTVIPPAQLEGVSLLARFGTMPRVRCQAAQVSQALLALIKNALQAVQDRPDKVGAVTIRGGMADEGLFVEVADTGVGMAPEVLARAFEPLFTTRPGGLGLGLAAASDCAHVHGGRLEATSELGEGSVFRLWLPLNLH